MLGFVYGKGIPQCSLKIDYLSREDREGEHTSEGAWVPYDEATRNRSFLQRIEPTLEDILLKNYGKRLRKTSTLG
jgi:hypothetical protein